MKTFLIGGTIIDDTAQAFAFEDVTPAQVRSFIKRCEDGEEITFDISSPGGSVTAGIAIANIIRDAAKTRKCKAHVVGIAASMASVIACACDEIDIDESAFMMIHNPWTVTEGDADDLRKSAEILDQMKAAILSFYRSKFDKTDDEISALMDDETWFTGAEAAAFGFKANVIASTEPLRAAACARRLPNFAKAPAAAEHLFVVAKEIPSDTTASDGSEPADENAAPASAAPASAEPAAADAAPAPTFEQRLAAAMRSRDNEINALKAKIADVELRAVDLAASIEKDFKNQLAAKDKELMTAKAEITRLSKEVESAKIELQATASALEAKSKALATLNASVNTPSAAPREITVNARVHLASLIGSERARFYREHKDAVDNNQIIKL